MKRVVTIIGLLTFVSPAFSQGKVFEKDGAAINGFDAVAYFTEGKPVKGDNKFLLKWNDATWLFVSKENLEKFKSQPEKYSPQFGGFCSFGVSKGYKVSSDPDAWTVVNGKLYLNYSLKVKEDWMKDRDNLISTAEKKWVDINE
jgi:hypothetical protein